jgi:hypothetical protein
MMRIVKRYVASRSLHSSMLYSGVKALILLSKLFFFILGVQFSRFQTMDETRHMDNFTNS